MENKYKDLTLGQLVDALCPADAIEWANTPEVIDYNTEKAPKATTEKKGLKYDDNKPMMYLIPPLAEEAEARVWTYGDKKYTDPVTGEPVLFNWKKGITYSRILSSLQRHLLAIKKGEDIDPETGELHAAAIRCNAAMLIEFTLTKRTELDDRDKK